MNKAHVPVSQLRSGDNPSLPVLRPNYESTKLLEHQKEIESLKNEIADLKYDIQLLRKKEKESIKTELQYKQLIRTYQQELSKNSILQSKMPTEESEKNVHVIGEAYDKVYDCIKQLQDRIDDMLVNKEVSLIAVFDAKLQEISKELENEKKAKLEYIEGLAERENKSLKELEILRGSVELIEAKNCYLETENKRLRGELKQARSEYENLERRLFQMKESRPKPRVPSPKSLISPKSSTSVLLSPPVSPGSRVNSFLSSKRSENDNADARYQQVIEKLKKSIEFQKNNLRAARTAYIREIQNKNEIEQVVQVCLDEVKKQLVQNKDKTKNKGENTRQELINKLTTQEEILSLLYQKVHRNENQNQFL
ncbi:unnamed protein product [Blepharisma stoltei]|uniref:Uncharacterized protein n=1 Tax=Blepharisma stoltei TaxID=1481888 RepID=A0AAU9J8A2_9CILI|nr:unnamed protein product [Blepharisma stoltei]